VSILFTSAAHRNLCDFINLTIFFFLIRISNSSFVFILHVVHYMGSHKVHTFGTWTDFFKA
jgi:hypothetical protein